MIYYYQIKKNSEDLEVFGVTHSQSFREYADGRMWVVSDKDIKNSNFFIYEGQYYRAAWMKVIPGMEDTYPTMYLTHITEEEYIDFLNKQEKTENLE